MAVDVTGHAVDLLRLRNVHAMVGGLPGTGATDTISAEAEYSLAPWPMPLGKSRVEVETQVVVSATRARLPLRSEQPGISVRAPAQP